jgi:methylenetetrahydrofolate reductase (NADPH)
VPALIRYAKRCGVNASLRGLMSGAASALIGNVGPDRIIDVLSDAQGELGELGELGAVHLHYFSFGGLVATARYAQEKAGANTAPAIASSR